MKATCKKQTQTMGLGAALSDIVVFKPEENGENEQGKVIFT